MVLTSDVRYSGLFIGQQELSNLLQSATSVDEKIRLVKTIDNFGDAGFLPVLKTIIQDTRGNKMVRINAIKALNNLTSVPEVREEVSLMWALCWAS